MYNIAYKKPNSIEHIELKFLLSIKIEKSIHLHTLKQGWNPEASK